MENNYVVYHLHDDYSNPNGYYDSCTKFNEYVDIAVKQGMKAIAFSNHGNVYDWILKKIYCDKKGIKYIHGVEMYMCTELEENEKGFHIGLYAKNLEGVKELNQLVSIATSKGNKNDNSDRHFYTNPRLSMQEIMNTSKNIIITTACLASFLWKSTVNKYKLDYRDRFLKWMSENNDRCFLEIQYHDMNEQIKFNQLLYKWSKEYNIPLIAGTDTHSLNDYKAKCRIILQKSQKNGNNIELAYENNLDLTWKSYEELIDMFKKQNALPENAILDAINNTNKLADMCENWELDRSFKYPNLYGDNATIKWKNLIYRKFQEKKQQKALVIDELDKYKKLIEEEFEVMKKQGMESFMMFMSELLTWCQENNIPYGRCRGSVGGSVIAYITDITDVDPIRWKTVFSRFCNAHRISLADIDVDFAPEDREKVYEYIIKRFTPKKTAYISQFGTVKTRGAIDVLARGLNYTNLDTVAKIKDTYDKLMKDYAKIIQAEVNLEELEIVEARSIDFEYHEIYKSRIKNKNAIEDIDNLKRQFDKLINENQDLFYYFDGIRGTIISKGNHPAGIIGSPITIADNIGVFYKDGNENIPISQCAMKAVDYCNYIKFDILGLKTIGILKDTYNYIGQKWQKSHEINWNDMTVWKNMMISRVGVFQFEGDFAFKLLKKFEPQSINDMSLVNASLRPSGKSYRDRLINKEFNKNPSEQIDKLLKDNYGFLVYQEDTIKFLTDICGFDGSLADTVRRAIGKKDHDLLHEQLPKIIEGYCENSNKPREIAEKEVKKFLQIIEDSSEYQFGYNHSTGYSMNGYDCVRLRTYYPLEFTTAYLNRAENEEDIQMGTELAKLLGFKIKPARFRYSTDIYTFDKSTNTIYKGISSIKNLSSQAAKELYELRNNFYDTFFDLLKDIKEKTSINSTKLDVLIKLDFFDEFGNSKFLLECTKYFTLFNYGKLKQISADKLEQSQIPINIVERYSRLSSSGKTYMDLNMDCIFKELYEYLQCTIIEDFSIKEKIKFQQEYLGYINTRTNKEEDRRKLIVLDIKPLFSKKNNNIWGYSLKTMSLGSGNIAQITIGSYNYDNQPFEKYNIIYAKKLEKKNGYWWCTAYNIIHK